VPERAARFDGGVRLIVLLDGLAVEPCFVWLYGFTLFLFLHRMRRIRSDQRVIDWSGRRIPDVDSDD
jgi:hypothetical protein